MRCDSAFVVCNDVKGFKVRYSRAWCQVLDQMLQGLANAGWTDAASQQDFKAATAALAAVSKTSKNHTADSVDLRQVLQCNANALVSALDCVKLLAHNQWLQPVVANHRLLPAALDIVLREEHYYQVAGRLGSFATFADVNCFCKKKSS